MTDGDFFTRSTVFAAAAQERPRSLMRGGLLLLAAVVVLRVVAGHILQAHDPPPPRKPLDVMIVKLVQPPPPPPPPPRRNRPDPGIAAVKDAQPAEKPRDMVVERTASYVDPPARLSLAAKPKGPPDVFNLPASPEGGAAGGDGGAGWGWYASLVQEQISAALRADPRTRDAVMQVRVQLWADTTGRVRKINMLSSTGDAQLDAVIRNNVFASLVLREPPPKGMPMPIIAHVSSRRSG